MKRTVFPPPETPPETTQAPKTGQRRYPAGKFPAYDETYNLKLKRSAILNPEARRSDSSMAFSMQDLHGLKHLLQTFDGEKGTGGLYMFRGTWNQSLIPAAEEKLLNINAQFKKWAFKRVTDGYSMMPPEHWPGQMLSQRLATEAVLDVLQMEKAKVIEMIAEREAADEAKIRDEDNLSLLRFGPQCKGYHGESPDPKIDGQRVSFTEAGQPYISDPRSPYHSISLVDYRRMSEKWLELLRIKSKEKAAEMEKDSKGLEVPIQHYRPRQIFRKRPPRPDQLPEPPADAHRIEVPKK